MLPVLGARSLQSRELSIATQISRGKFECFRSRLAACRTGIGASLGHEIEIVEAGVFIVHATNIRFAAQSQLAVDNLGDASSNAASL